MYCYTQSADNLSLIKILAHFTPDINNARPYFPRAEPQENVINLSFAGLPPLDFFQTADYSGYEYLPSDVFKKLGARGLNNYSRDSRKQMKVLFFVFVAFGFVQNPVDFGVGNFVELARHVIKTNRFKRVGQGFYVLV